MNSVKQSVIDLLAKLPDDCTYEDVQYHLYVREKIERGLKAIENGEVISQEEVEQRMEEWLRSLGADRP